MFYNLYAKYNLKRLGEDFELIKKIFVSLNT